MVRDVFRFRQDTAHLQIDTSVVTLLAGGTGSRLWSFTVAAANFQAGDTLRFDLKRDGAHADDTSSAAEEYDGAWVEYTGRA